MDPPSSAPPSPPSSPRPAAGSWLADWLKLPADGPPRRLMAAAGVIAAAAVVAVVAYALVRAPGPAPQLTLPRAGAESAGGTGPPPADAPGPGPTTPPTSAVVTVHVAGAVASPGVYALAAGGRVADAVTAAGGPLPEADVDRLNLAARVNDGDRVAVPRKGDPATPDPPPPAAAGAPAGASSSGPSTVPTGPIDLNRATNEQLDTLPGVGPATAQAIVTYRTRHGRFRSVTELLEVPGIGPAKLEAIRPLVRV